MQVLSVLADIQFRDKTSRGGVEPGHPSLALQEAAGLKGQSPARTARDSIRNAALKRIGDAGVNEDALLVLRTAITTDNVARTANAVLRTPELLCLPAQFQIYARRSDNISPRRQASEQFYLSLCFVSSAHTEMNFHNVWDINRQHPAQVRDRSLTCSHS